MDAYYLQKKFQYYNLFDGCSNWFLYTYRGKNEFSFCIDIIFQIVLPIIGIIFLMTKYFSLRVKSLYHKSFFVIYELVLVILLLLKLR